MHFLVLKRLLRQEVIPMPDRLYQHESAIQHNRDNRDKGQLRRAVERPLQARCVVRQDQRQYGNCSQGRHRGRDAVEAKTLFPVAAGTDQQTSANNAIQNDHDRCKHGIACQTMGRFTAAEHERDNQRHLDQGHCQRQYQRTEWLTNLVRDHFSVVHRRQHAGHQRHHQ